MTSKKSGFWTFLFSLIPGAGEMYLGFLKHGASVMILFFGIFALTAGFNLNFLMFLLPVVWCYSFFHTHAILSMPDEEFYALEDRFLFLNEEDTDSLSRRISGFLSYHRSAAAWLLIILGVTLLWNSFMDYLYQILPQPLYDALYTFSYHLPQIFLAILFIGLGCYLIRGKKRELDEEDPDCFYDSDPEAFQDPPSGYCAPSQAELPSPVRPVQEQEPEPESGEKEKDTESSEITESAKESDEYDKNA